VRDPRLHFAARRATKSRRSQRECFGRGQSGGFVFAVKFGSVGERRRPLDQMQTVVNAPINRTVCELTGTKSARRFR